MDITTLAIAIAYTNKVGEKISKEGFKVQVETDRTILDTVGNEKTFYFLPKTESKPQDGYDEYIYTNNAWEQVGVTDIDLSSYAQQTWVSQQIKDAEEIYIGETAPQSDQVLWIDTDDENIRYGAGLRLDNTTLSLVDQNGTPLNQVDISGRIDLSNSVITLDIDEFTYDGTSKIPAVISVVLDGDTLTVDEDYTISSYSSTNAGYYSIKIYGIGDYKGMASVDWRIKKATPIITGAQDITIMTLGETKEETYTTNGDGIFTFSILNNSYASVTTTGGKATITSIAKGNTSLVINLSEGLNYESKQELIPLTIMDGMCFGVMWNYGVSSPILTRLTKDNDPNGHVTHSPTTEPSACIGTATAGQSWFDDYMPWAGMVRKNYVNGGIVDFVNYANGETYIYIPQFWSKIINDSNESKMYIYISAVAADGFTLHPGSGRYMSRYECNSDFLSAPGTTPKVNTNLTNFRTNITAIDNKHYQYDIHTYNALQLLYIVEFANLNTQSKIGAGITSGGTALSVGQTDVLTYHTGRIDDTDNVSAVQYRWIENLWGNVWNWVDGVLIQDGLVYICNDITKYASSITDDYISTGLYTPATGWYKTAQELNNCYLIPATTGGSDSTYTCDYYYYDAGLRGLYVGGRYGNGSNAGLFYWRGDYEPGYAYANLGGRAVLVDSNE